jgi:glycosyltransferase involved in cell wall biosynthesis
MTAVALAGLLGVPAVIKVHGTDINVLGDMRLLRPQLRWYLPRANRIVVVSRALGAKVATLGVPESKIDLVRNGVDTTLFYPRDRQASRTRLARPSDSRILLYVGWLLETKGIFDLLDAFARVAAKDPQAELVLIGDGPARAAIAARQKKIPRITLTGALPPEEVAIWLGACNVLTLPSWSEGTPNVVLEALAAGRRVVATDVGGIPDLITSPEVGTLVPVRAPEALADALSSALSQDYDPARVAKLGSPGSWEDSARTLFSSLERAVAGP